MVGASNAAVGKNMTESRPSYHVTYRDTQPLASHAILDTDVETVRSKLVDIECQLISLLVTVQRALGKEPSVMTRAERRRG